VRTYLCTSSPHSVNCGYFQTEQQHHVVVHIITSKHCAGWVVCGDEVLNTTYKERMSRDCFVRQIYPYNTAKFTLTHTSWCRPISHILKHGIDVYNVLLTGTKIQHIAYLTIALQPQITSIDNDHR